MDSQSEDDKATIAAVLAGNRQQFGLLVRRYHRPLLHLATSRLGNQDAAEDAVQDTFICAYRSLHTYKPAFSFRTWLWTILLNQCRRHGTRISKLPKQSDEKSTSSMAQEADSDGLTPDLSAMMSERSRLLGELLQRIPDAQADAIRLRFFGQLKYREIAQAMDSSLGAAKQRVRLGLVAVGKMLHEQKLVDSVFPEDK